MADPRQARAALTLGVVLTIFGIGTILAGTVIAAKAVRDARGRDSAVETATGQQTTEAAVRRLEERLLRLEQERADAQQVFREMGHRAETAEKILEIERRANEPLRNKVEELSGALAGARAEAAQLKADRAAGEAETGRLSKDRDAAEKAVEELRRRAEAVEKALAGERRAIGQLRSEAEKSEAALAAARSELAEGNAAHAAAGKRVVDLEARLSEERERASALETELAEVRAELAEARKASAPAPQPTLPEESEGSE